jgi:type IV pilus assembly protein PilQ
VLSLEAAPQITPDDSIIMDLSVDIDSIGQLVSSVISGFIPIIDTCAVKTQVLVDNGQIVVLGGIYEQNINKRATPVSFFSDIPLFGRLFRNDHNTTDRLSC